MNVRATQTVLMGLIVIGFGGVNGCAWVKPEDGAQSVILADEPEVSSCQRKGQTTSNVKSSLGVLTRRKDTVSQELIALAKNSALSLGGDTIVAVSEPKEGSQVFSVYKCR